MRNIWKNERLTISDNSMLAVRFTHLNTFGTSQTRRPLCAHCKEPFLPINIPSKNLQDDPTKSFLKNSKCYSIDKLWIAICEGIDNFVKDIESNKELKKNVESNWKKIVYDEPAIIVE